MFVPDDKIDLVTMSRSVELILRCDACNKSACKIKKGDSLPKGWVIVNLSGWVGDFHACSEMCRKSIESREKRRSERDTIPCPGPPECEKED